MYGINFVHLCVIQIVSDEVLILKSKHKDRFMRFSEMILFIFAFVLLFGSWVTKQIVCLSFCWLSKQRSGSFPRSGGGGTEYGGRGCRTRGRRRDSRKWTTTRKDKEDINISTKHKLE